MKSNIINLWIEGDISTNRILSRFIDDIQPGMSCNTHFFDAMNWRILSAGINIFCRICDPRYEWLPNYLRERDIKYIFYLDDNFWQIQGDTELARHYQSESVISTLDEFLSCATLVIVNSESLHEFIKARFPSSVCRLLKPPFDTRIVKSCLDLDDSNWVSEKLTIGYAGGYKHEEFQLIEQVIRSLHMSHPKLRFEFIGGCSNELKRLPAVSWFPGVTDYEAFIEFKVSRKWSIGLAPLWASSFNTSKTNNKYREYGGCGIPGIYSNIPPYQQCIRNGENGILVENTVEAWVAAIRALIESSELRVKIRKNAFHDVDANYSHQEIAPAWAETLLALQPPIPASGMERLRFRYCMELYRQGNSGEAEWAAKMKGSELHFWLAKQWIKGLIKRQNLKLIFWLILSLTLLNINLFLLHSCTQ
jgi:glycosyltransferase involved in cell wall biosynthesis